MFEVTYSTTLYDKDGNLMSGQVSADGQWRFYPTQNVPERYKQALITYEDEWFRYHFGLNPVSVVRAGYANFKADEVVRGGSTITMQVARMANPKARTLWNKFREMFVSIKLELNYSKDEILNLYANHAPFGGNVVGIEAASWRYFGRQASDLSWAEASLLAVLPNAPSLIRLDKNRELLLQKRDRLLAKLYQSGAIDDSIDYKLALDEPLPDGFYTIPSNAKHLFGTLKKSHLGEKIHTSLDGRLQEYTQRTIEREAELLAMRGIKNVAALIIDNQSGRVISYVGNSQTDPLTRDVDIIRSPRSSGSILKPFLYSASLEAGNILPTTLLIDIPTYYRNFSPNNFDKTFSGAVKANEALTRSLNIPAVRLLAEFTPGRFMNLLHQLGFSTINRGADDYGLSLILGGAEVTLWDVCQGYYQLANTAQRHDKWGTNYSMLFSPLTVEPFDNESNREIMELSVASSYLILNELTNVVRPPEEQGWEEFAENRKIGWKTGTSFGFKDAWAVGVTPEYTVGVWVGNANGEGNNSIIGGLAAAPIMFQLFKQLPATSWFTTPYELLEPVAVCRSSGYRVSPNCSKTEVDTILSLPKGKSTPLCPYHKLVSLTADGKYRTNSNSTSVWEMKQVSYFSLPASVEYYYRLSHPEYQNLPPLLPSVEDATNLEVHILYPEEGAKIYLPIGLNGKQEQLVVKVAHRNRQKPIFWHLDGDYLDKTEMIHSLSISPSVGNHTLMATDENGNSVVRHFTIIAAGRK